MWLRSLRLLLLLFSGLQADVQEKEVRAMVGSNVNLTCIYPEKNSFDLSDLFVYWQISVPGQQETVVAYYLSGNSSTGHHDDHYRHRARLSLEGMKQGDFSLLLSNVTPQDAQKFKCLVFRKSLGPMEILQVVITLNVAANYSMPVVSIPSAPSQDKELTFTCTSTNGYPRPNVYWINKTDNSLLDEALQNNTVSLNERGLYDVVSILKIQWSPNVNVGCCIENVLLHQNLTVSSQTEMLTGTKDSITEKPTETHEERNRALFSILAILAVAVAVATGWMCRSRCPGRSGTGTRRAREVPGSEAQVGAHRPHVTRTHPPRCGQGFCEMPRGDVGRQLEN
ncbi:ICOS ligand-like isoform X1 [Equus quagga]|uniref:ICOS ligand-like isoform X1 n=1 Tax=Equus quagga TaxID=89248 RepID=UPI001EE226C0|nr:ICOS ligand-like isoform X1 [Equus quagga]